MSLGFLGLLVVGSKGDLCCIRCSRAACASTQGKLGPGVPTSGESEAGWAGRPGETVASVRLSEEAPDTETLRARDDDEERAKCMVRIEKADAVSSSSSPRIAP